MPEITFEVTKELGVLSENPNGWKKELNLVSWNGRKPKYDIREWSPDKTRMTKGITLSDEEIETLKNLLEEI